MLGIRAQLQYSHVY